MEGLDVGLLVGLGLDSVIVSALFLYFKNRSKTLHEIQEVSEFDVNTFSEGELPKVIEYGMVVGKVAPIDTVLHSNYDKEYRGVLRKLEIREHITSARDSILKDTVRVISSVTNDEPFKLKNKNWEILVEKAMKADFIDENLKQTYNHFDVNKESFTSKVVTALVAKETVKGIETTESMLLNGTVLTCFGRLEQLPYKSSSPLWVPGVIKYKYKLSPPSFGHTYIVTSMTRDELVSDLKSTTRGLKWSLILFGSIGFGIAAYLAWKYGRSYAGHKLRQYRLHQAKLKRIADRKARREAGAPAESEQGVVNSCVVCLTSPREVILLDCGHVCLCMDCLEMMPSQTCPICREQYRSFAPAYIS